MADDESRYSNVEKFFEKVSGLAGDITDSFKTWYQVSDITNRVLEIDEAAYRVVKTFGVGAENVRAIKTGIIDSRDRLLEVGMSSSEIVDTFEKISSTTNRNLLLSTKSVGDLGATMKATNMEASTLIQNFKDAGFGLGKISTEMQKAVDVAKAQGLNVSVVSENVVKNLDKMNLYTFQGGVDGLSRMAAQAATLRIDMNKTFQLADKLFSPEQAIDMAASLQRLGVAQSSLLDPLKLMDLAQNDPEELQKQIIDMTKSFGKFNEETGKFEIPAGARRQLREIEDALGYSRGELSKMAVSAVEFDDKMSKISFGNLEVSEDQKKMIANMAEMGKGGEYQVKFRDERGDVIETSVDKLTEAQLKTLTKLSEPMPIEDIAKSQLSAQEYANKQLEIIAGRPGYAAARTDVGEDLLKTTKQLYDFSGELSKTILPFKESSQFVDDFTKQIGSATRSFANALDGKGSISDALSKLSIAGDNVSQFMEGRYKESLELLSKKYTDAANEFDRMKEKWAPLNVPTTSVKDVEISANGQKISLLPEDTLFAGTNPQSLAGRIMEVMNSKKETTNPTPLSSTLDVNHRVTFDNLPQYISAKDLSRHMEIALNENLSLQQGIISTLAKASENYGTT